jgi:anaerobic ribonucleoside-triphosphate reductase
METKEESPTMKFIKKLLKEAGTGCIELKGSCQSCSKEVKVFVWARDMGVEGTGGIIVGKELDALPEFKCMECLNRDGGRISPTRTEVYSRVVGYLRPVKGYNKGKKEEFHMRKNYKLS